MAARMTINTSSDGELQIWLNEEGRDLLVKNLQKLSQTNDHFHLDPYATSGMQLSEKPYRDGDNVFEWAKIMLRTDDWDTRYFPHVLGGMPDVEDR